MHENFTYLSQKQLGQIAGGTSHDIGKWLKNLGLRTPKGEPTFLAKDGGYCQYVVTADGHHRFWAWHREKTLAAFREAGLMPPSEPEPVELQEPAPNSEVAQPPAMSESTTREVIL